MTENATNESSTARSAAAIPPAAAEGAVAPPAAEPPPNPLARERLYSIPRAEVDAEVDRRLLANGRDSKFKGFRPGKAPLSFLRARLGDSAQREVLTEKAQSRLADDWKSESERPAGRPEISIEPALEDSYRARCAYEVLPQIEPPDFSRLVDGKPIAVETPTLAVGEAEVDEMLARMQNERAEFVEVARAAQDGDRVVVDYRAETESQPTAQGEDRVWEVGHPGLPPQIADALRGAAAGDSRETVVAHDDSHPESSLRGKQTRFSILVKSVRETRRPPIDADFARAFGIESGDIGEMREKIRAELEREVERRLRHITRELAFDALLQATPPHPMPQTLVTQEAAAQWQAAREEARAAGIDEGKIDPRSFLPAAVRRARLALLLGELKKLHPQEIAAEEKEIDEILAAHASRHSNPEEALQMLRADRRQVAAAALAALEDKAARWILAQVPQTTKPVALAAILDSHA